ncbi:MULTISPECIES: glycosyltransferase family 2 protein [Mesorhizobium]|nr:MULTISPECIES: glycosyltransferase family A protein [Mesorhizobium]
MAKVQILIPCYNYARYLTACVESVTSQPGVDLDILIIDDCSSDNTPEVCRELMARDSRIRVIRHEKNMRHIATYNEGIADIRGDYFLLLSADDLLTPGALQRATSIMEANPNVGMVYGNAISFWGEPSPARTNMTGSTIWSGRKWMQIMCRSGRNFLVSPEGIVRASIQRRIGGYDPALPHSGDMEMWLRIAAISDIGYVRGADQAYYRIHPASMQRTIHAGMMNDLKGRELAFRSTFEKEGATLPERDALYAMARKALAFTTVQHARKLTYFPDENDLSAEEYLAFADTLYPEGKASERYAPIDKGAHTIARIRDASSCMAVKAQEILHKKFLNRVEHRWASRRGTYFPRTSG